MNIEELEKLNELKEKGIITQEEFDKKKEEMLSGGNKAQKQASNMNWYNLGISFLCGLGSFGIIVAIPHILYAMNINVSEGRVGDIKSLIFFLFGLIMSIMAYKLETKKYKNATPFWATFLVIGFVGSLVSWLGSFAIWFESYELLQIKDGLKELKVKKNK